MFDNLRADFEAAAGDRTLEKGLLRILMRFETPAVVCYRFSSWVTKLRIPVVRQLLMVVALLWQRFNQMFFGIFISPDAEIGPGFVIHTPYGINVGPAKIGPNFTVCGGTLVGSGCRVIGENVYLGAGCKIVGEAKIGNNVVVVANSVVLIDVPDNVTIMGVPARIKLPGGRPKRFAWGAAKPVQKPQVTNGNTPKNGGPENGAPKNGSANGAKASVPQAVAQESAEVEKVRN
jgi:serine O-acetyltransferase